jgi:hypothetical protein
MLLAQIAGFISSAIRFKLHPDQVRLIMEAVQKQAFDYNSTAFLVWTNGLTVKGLLTFASAGYTSAIAGDIGKTVVGATSGSTGTLVSYDNTARTWILNTTKVFTNGEAISITTGTGAGTLDATTGYAGYNGPYAAPTSPPVRKIWGITSETDARIFGTSDPLVFPMEDFDFTLRNFDATRFFQPGREDNVAGTFTFAEGPDVTTTVYRWVYWRDAPNLPDFTDETLLLIPSRYHLNYVNACIKMAQITLSGDDVSPQVIQSFFQPWWNTLARPYTPMGKKTNQTLSPRQSSGVML